MRSLLKTILIATLLLGISFSEIAAAHDHTSDSPITIPLEQHGQKVDGPTLAYQLMRTFLTEKEWKSECKKIQGRFKDWESENIGGMDRYLNDRLVIVALSAAGGEPEKIQKGVIWLAFYKEFNQRPPSLVYKFLEEHQGSMNKLMNGFTWKKASAYVINKSWREDLNKDGTAAAEAEKPKAPAEKPVQVAQAELPKSVKKPAKREKKPELRPTEIAVAAPVALPEALTLASGHAERAYGVPRPIEIPLNDDDR